MVILLAVFFVPTDTDGGNNGGFGDRGRRDEASREKDRSSRLILRFLSGRAEMPSGRGRTRSENKKRWQTQAQSSDRRACLDSFA